MRVVVLRGRMIWLWGRDVLITIHILLAHIPILIVSDRLRWLRFHMILRSWMRRILTDAWRIYSRHVRYRLRMMGSDDWWKARLVWIYLIIVRILLLLLLLSLRVTLIASHAHIHSIMWRLHHHSSSSNARCIVGHVMVMARLLVLTVLRQSHSY